MKILIVDTYYPAFLRNFYARHPNLSRQPYTEHWRILMDQCFGTADFYSANLQKLGHDAHEVVANCAALQRQWTREHAFHLWAAYPLYRPLGCLKGWQMAVLQAQVEWFKPDVLYVQNLNWPTHRFLQWTRSKVHLIVGQHATLISRARFLNGYDLILSFPPNIVAHFRHQNIPCEYFRVGFESSILQRLSRNPTPWSVVHMGGYGPIHNERNALLEAVARQVPVDFWGYVVENLAPDSPIRHRYHGEAWGLDMYQIRHNSRIVLTGHISSVAGQFVGNMTLYEATGVGACLVTDMKDNLSQLFEPDREVVAYTSAEDCVEKVCYLLEHEDERAAIAKAGQERTLREHTYYHRMQELVDIVRKYL